LHLPTVKNQAGSQGPRQIKKALYLPPVKRSGLKSRQVKRALHLPAVKKSGWKSRAKADQKGLALASYEKIRLEAD
jgi:hypothetical protein